MRTAREDAKHVPPWPTDRELVDVRLRYNYPNATSPGGHPEDMLVRERPVESIRRRLRELKLTQAKVAQATGISEKHINQILTEAYYGSLPTLYALLDYVGLEMVAIPDQIKWRGVAGHWYHGERCEYCGINQYDAIMYEPGWCPKSPEKEPTP